MPHSLEETLNSAPQEQIILFDITYRIISQDSISIFLFFFEYTMPYYLEKRKHPSEPEKIQMSILLW